jgi:hypothetical protein
VPSSIAWKLVRVSVFCPSAMPHPPVWRQDNPESRA